VALFGFLACSTSAWGVNEFWVSLTCVCLSPYTSSTLSFLPWAHGSQREFDFHPSVGRVNIKIGFGLPVKILSGLLLALRLNIY
jgi:hypothetical protein